MKSMHALRARLRLLFRREAEERMDDEMRFHLEMETEKHIRAGLSPAEARRRARVSFGGVEGHKEAMRDGRTFAWIGTLSLDARLGLRLLARHRGLALIGGFAMAMAIAVGAVAFEALSQLLRGTLPLDEGDRVVAVHYATDDAGSPERQVLHDFAEWRGRLRTVDELSAFRPVAHNLVSGAGDPVPVQVAEMTASGFRVARTPPLLGRYLVPEDERPGAPAVVVIGHEAWRTRFAADPRIVGRTVRLGSTLHVVAGVMPEGFRFPLNHQYWVPLRESPLAHARLEGPGLYVFGRLAPGASLREARAELETVGRRTAAAHPRMYDRLRLTAVPFTYDHMDLQSPTLRLALRVVQLLVSGLLVVVAVNLAVLLYARTVSRLSEIAVRSALGASRRRILAQLFMEALAHSVLGALLGLVVANAVLGMVQRFVTEGGNGFPFWIHLRLSPATVAYALALAVVAAAIMGVLPGIRATGAGMQASLRELRSGPRLGPVWSGLIVAQVAFAMAVLPPAVYTVWQLLRMETAQVGFAPDEFVVGSVELGEPAAGLDSAGLAERAASRQTALMARLMAEPGVTAVALSSHIPGLDEPTQGVEIDGGTAPAGGASVIRTTPELFGAYGARIGEGRALAERDAGAASSAVVVNRTFVRRHLGNRSAVGQRLRYPRADGPGRWYEIVGVVEDFPAVPLVIMSANGVANVYHAALPGAIPDATLSVRVRGGVPAGFVRRVQRLGVEVDPELQLETQLLAEVYDGLRRFSRFMAWALALVTGSVLLLSAAGIYALMSFTVVQRTREIGIRTALGAQPRRIMASIFAPVGRRLVVGVAIGSMLAGAITVGAGVSVGGAAPLMAAVCAIMLAVGLLAALGPARRGLRIQPMEALREA
ncbi:MAG TPA: ABC transporter permease [Longimicrobium sp.]|jgi:predicted permease